MCLEEQKMPSKSQIALALRVSGAITRLQEHHSRLWVDLIKKPTAILPREDTREPPRLILKGLDILNLDEKYVSRLSCFNVEGAGEVVNLC
jgi:hypothetical protein